MSDSDGQTSTNDQLDILNFGGGFIRDKFGNYTDSDTSDGAALTPDTGV